MKKKLIGALVIALAFGGGFLFRGWSDPPRYPVPPKPLVIDLGSSGRYVALGDSYSAGEGLDPFQEGTQDIDEGGDRCHRSENYAYPVLLRFAYATDRIFRACSGAVVDNVFRSTQEHDGVPNSQGLQVAADVPGADVTLVTISMGGNDLDFAKVLTFCLRQRDCFDQPYKDAESLRAWIDGSLEELNARLIKLNGRLKESFPNARILVLGYPGLFPDKAPPLSKPHNAFCRILFSGWTASEREAIRDWGLRLNGATEAAAVAAGVEFVDISSHFAGHEPCSTGGEWVRFVGLSTNRAVRDGSFHPLRDGQAMMARIVSCHLEVFRPGDTTPTLTAPYAMTGCVARETTFVVEPPAAAS